MVNTFNRIARVANRIKIAAESFSDRLTEDERNILTDQINQNFSTLEELICENL